MKYFRSKIAFTALALAAFGASPALVPSAFAQTSPLAVPEKRNTDFTNILPADDTAGVLVVENFFKYAAFDVKTPMARLLAHPAVKQWTDNILPRIAGTGEILEATGLSEKDLPRLFTGKAVVAILLEHKNDDKTKPAAEEPVAPAGAVVIKADKAPPEPVALIEFKGSAAEYEELADKLEAYLKSKDPKADILRERAEGLLVHAYETDSLNFSAGNEPSSPSQKPERKKFFHTYANGTIVVARKKDRLLDAVRALARGATENPLSGRSDFIAVKKEMGENDGFLLVNLAALMQQANVSLRESLAAQGASNPAMKAMIDPETAVNALALQNFTSLYGSIKLDENRMEARYGLTWKDRSGVASLINFGKDPVSVPSFVSANYKGLDASTVDFPATLDAAIELVRAVSPGGYGMLGMMLAQNTEVETALTALRKGVLDNMRPAMITLTGYASVTPGDDEIPGRAYILEMKDPAAALAAIEATLAIDKDEKGEPKIKPVVKEYLGVKVYRLPAFPSPLAVNVQTGGGESDSVSSQMIQVAYAFIGDRLVVTAGAGDDGFIEGVIANMKNPGKPLVDARFEDNLGSLPGTPCSISYGDVATYLKTVMIELRKNGPHKNTGLTDADLIKARDACKDLRYFWAAKSYYDASGVYGRLVVTEQAEAGK